MASDLVLYGWEPGSFIGMRCRDCLQEQVDHDKRATRCERCAIAARNAAKTSLQSTRPRDILERLRDWPSLSAGLDQLHAEAVEVIQGQRAELERLRAQAALLPLADAEKTVFSTWGDEARSSGH